MILWRHLTACCAKKTSESAGQNKERAVVTAAVPVAVLAVHLSGACVAEAPGDATRAVDHDRFP